MTLVSGNIRRMQIFAGASNGSGVVDDGNFWRFGWLLHFFGTFEIRPAILHGDMLPLVGQ